MTILVLLQMICAAALAWSCFCRLVRVDLDTHREIRLTIWFEGLAAGLVFGAPVLPLLVPEITWEPWTTPRWIWLSLLVAATLIQLATAKYWNRGVPAAFRFELPPHPLRRSTDKPPLTS